jgi:hypothetical protein
MYRREEELRVDLPEEELRVEYVAPPTFTLNPGEYDAPEVDMPPPQTIEIQQDGQAVQIAGWEVRWPPVGSSFIFRDDVGTSEE